MTELKNNSELWEQAMRILRECAIKRKAFELTIAGNDNGMITKFHVTGKHRLIEQIRSIEV